MDILARPQKQPAIISDIRTYMDPKPHKIIPSYHLDLERDFADRGL